MDLYPNLYSTTGHSKQLYTILQGRRKLMRGGAAAQRPRVFPREALKNFLDRFLNDKEAALVAARYIKGHHVCCFS